MSKLIYDGRALKFENGKLIHSATPANCVCCGAPSISESDSPSDSLSESSESVFDGECCLYADGATVCVERDEFDTTGAACLQCHSDALPTTPGNDPDDNQRSAWVPNGNLFTYDMTNGNWSVNVKACPIWYDATLGRTYWPPVPNVDPSDYGDVITTTTAANAVLTSITVNKPSCVLQSTWRGCDRHYNCDSLTVSFAGTSNVPSCTHCPACGDYSSANDWGFGGWYSPHNQTTGGVWEEGEDPCGSDPWAISNWVFGITEDCNHPTTSRTILAEVCDTC